MVEYRACADPPDAEAVAQQVALLRLMERTIFDALVAAEGAPEAFPQALHNAVWNRIDELDAEPEMLSRFGMVSRVTP